MAATNKIVAVPGMAGQAAGAVVWWALSGDTDLSRLAANWRAAGLDMDMLPEPPTPQVALRRAVSEQKAARRLARPLEGKKGRALVDETAQNMDLDYGVLVRVTVDVLGRLEFDGGNEKLRNEIKAAYERNLDVLAHSDISDWIIGLASSVDAVLLRQTGGLYFIPETSMDRWSKMVSVIRASSAHAVFEIPALRTESAATLFLDALAREAASEAEALEEELVAGDLGERALHSRVDRVSETLAKVARYEALLGGKLDVLRERLDGLKANLAAAALAAMED